MDERCGQPRDHPLVCVGRLYCERDPEHEGAHRVGAVTWIDDRVGSLKVDPNV